MYRTKHGNLEIEIINTGHYTMGANINLTPLKK
jgi:hypothetical protein